MAAVMQQSEALPFPIQSMEKITQLRFFEFITANIRNVLTRRARFRVHVDFLSWYSEFEV
jgi:dUTPase